MPDLHDRLAARRATFQPDPGGFERLVRRRHRREMRRRITAGVAALAIAVGVVVLLSALRPGGRRETPAITPDNVASLRVAWTARVEGTPSAPTIAGDTVYVVADRLSAFPVGCATSCEPTWTGDIGAASTSAPAVANGVVVVSSPTGLTAFAIDCGTGGATCDPLWTAPTPAPQPPEAGVGINDNVVVGFSAPVGRYAEVLLSGPAGVYAFRTDCRTDGGPCTPEWIARGAGSTEPPAVGAGAIYEHSHLGVEAFPLFCEQRRCDPFWSAPLPGSDTQTVSAAGDDLIVVDGTAYRWNRDQLVTVWRGYVTAPRSELSATAVEGRTIYMAADRVYAFAFDCGSQGAICHPTWMGPLDTSTGWSQPAIGDGLVFTSSSAPAAFVPGCSEGAGTCAPVWTGRSGSGLSRPAVAPTAVVVTSADGGVTAYRPAGRS
jgi:hypothetical protein